jgi:hypothetical protein
MRAKHYRVAIPIAAVVVVSSFYLTTRIMPAAPVAAIDAVADIAPARYMTHVTNLAGDALKGRGNGSPELDEAADSGVGTETGR